MMFVAWHGAVFERSKQMPALDRVLSPRPQQRQGGEEVKAAMQRIFASRKRGEKGGRQ